MSTLSQRTFSSFVQLPWCLRWEWLSKVCNCLKISACNKLQLTQTTTSEAGRVAKNYRRQIFEFIRMKPIVFKRCFSDQYLYKTILPKLSMLELGINKIGGFFSPSSLLNTNILAAAWWHIPLSATPSVLEPFTAHDRLNSSCMVKSSKQKHIANYT